MTYNGHTGSDLTHLSLQLRVQFVVGGPLGEPDPQLLPQVLHSARDLNCTSITSVIVTQTIYKREYDVYLQKPCSA